MNSKPKPPPPRVIIVGGGLAGLACAAGLVGRGLEIILLESRPRLGGRASSFTDPATGEMVDNCQHVSMACCTNLADFCRRVGIDSMMRRDAELTFLSPAGRVSKFRGGLSPAPFHLAGSFLRFSALTLGEKFRVARALSALTLSSDERPGEPFSDWLMRHGQSVRAMNLFWAAILTSALNERLEHMDVGYARKVFIEGFLRNRLGYQLELPLVPLGELYGTRLETWLREQNVSVQMTTGVRSVDLDDEQALRGVILRSGDLLAADFVILAVPFDRVPGLIPATAQERFQSLACIDKLRGSPITGIHLWYDRTVCPYDHVVTPGRLIQWVFNHTAIQGRTASPADFPDEAASNFQDRTEGGQYLQLVISASYDLLGLDKVAIRDAVLAELEEIWPEARAARVLRYWVVTEHAATLSIRPGIDTFRPSQCTPIDGLFLAGDWTDTGWPATMEGAVRSGYLVAQGILETLDRPTRLIRPALKPGFLAHWLLGNAEIRRGSATGTAGGQNSVDVEFRERGVPKSMKSTPPRALALFCLFLLSVWVGRSITPTSYAAGTQERKENSQPQSSPEVTPEATCRWAATPPVLDGKLDDPCWKEALPIDRFGIFWAKASAPEKATVAYLVWDNTALYYAAAMNDAELQSFGTRRNDTLWHGDVFELFFKPSAKRPAYYEFQANPRGVVFEMYFPKRGIARPDYSAAKPLGSRAVAALKGTLDRAGDRDLGWIVEGRVPWSAFAHSGGKPKQGDDWLFALCRYDYGPKGTAPVLTSSAPLTQSSFHRYEDYGKIRFEGPVETRP
jgi:squalene-associated FAD-dependent desaturase